jgi:hypothetical protein
MAEMECQIEQHNSNQFRVRHRLLRDVKLRHWIFGSRRLDKTRWSHPQESKFFVKNSEKLVDACISMGGVTG